jgi:hypothetical protein
MYVTWLTLLSNLNIKFNFVSNGTFIESVYYQKYCKKKQKHKNQFLVILKILL